MKTSIFILPKIQLLLIILHYNTAMQFYPFLFLQDWFNRLDYALRQLFRWKRGKVKLQNQPKENLFHELTLETQIIAQSLEERLRSEYHLDYLSQHSSRENYRENLYYLSLLETTFNQAKIRLHQEITVADIGVSSWFYVQALAAFLKWHQAPDSRMVHLYGYERDAFRVYTDFHSRFDHAQAYMNGLHNVHYLPQPFNLQADRFDLIFMLFPFVFLADHLKWGLPKNQFQPETLLSIAWQSLKKGGFLVIVNQGEREHLAQKQLLEKVAIPIHNEFKFESPLFHYDLERYVLVATNND
ncbi:MAG: hypothetical protein ACPL3P_08900 [Anaerolineales bacterium]